MIDYDNILIKLEVSLKEIEKSTKINNISKINARKTRYLEKNINKYVIQLVNSDIGINKYELWLLSNDITLKWNVALNLFSLYPNKCYNILVECKKDCKDELVKNSMKDVINAYKKGINDNNVFLNRLKNIYNTLDLSNLNRENN